MSSWMVTSPSGKVFELYTQANVIRAELAGWKVESAAAYLARINAEIRAKG